MIENTDKMVAAILAAARFQKLTATSTRSIVACYDECLAALLASRPPIDPAIAAAGDVEAAAEQDAWARHEADNGGG